MLKKVWQSRTCFNFIRTLLAVGIALGLTMVIIMAVSETPGEAISYFIFGPLKKMSRLANVVEAALPLIFTGLAISLIARTGIINLASEGAFYFSGALAALAAVKLDLPPVVLPFVCILVAGVGGVATMLVPVVIRLKYNASEIVASLMFNYVLFYLGSFLIRTFVKDPASGALQSLPFSDNAHLPRIIPGTRIHAGLILATVCVAALWLYLYKSRWGYKMRMVGSNRKFAVYSGISAGAAILIGQGLAGLACGIGGASEMLGMYNAFMWKDLPGFGWDGIIVATLARNNPAMVPLGAFFLAYMRVGADIMTRMTDVPNEIVSIIQGVVIILLVAENFLAGWEKKRTFAQATANVKLEGGK